jgi:hypothetical protein
MGHWVGLSPICVFESGSTMGMTMLTAALVEYDRGAQRIGFGNVSEASCAGQQPAVFGPFLAARPDGLTPGSGGCVDTSVHCGPVVTNNQALFNSIGLACGIVGIALLLYTAVKVLRARKSGVSPQDRQRGRSFALPRWFRRRRAEVAADSDNDHELSGDDDGDDDALLLVDPQGDGLESHELM